MPRGLVVYSFGPFEFDPASGTLARDGKKIRLPDSHARVLACLLDADGDIVSNDGLVDAGWRGDAVNDNSLEKAVSRLRKHFAKGDPGVEYIGTVPQRGYRFTHTITRVHRAVHDEGLEAQLAPYLQVVRSQAMLDTLDVPATRAARDALEALVRDHPEYGAAWVTLGMACNLLFEATSLDREPDAATLARGIEAAQIGCAKEPDSAEAFATLALGLGLKGETEAALAAAYKALELDRSDWRHAVRAARISWGELRLRFARRMHAMCPALGHWLTITVLIARNRLDDALREAVLGCAAQDAQKPGTAFRAVGLHLLRGNVLAALGRFDEAIKAFMRELEHLSEGAQIWARECTSHTWYALAGALWHLGQHQESDAALRKALEAGPGHAAAHAALHNEVLPGASPINAAIARAIILKRANRTREAAQVVFEALQKEPPGSAAWILPVEPFLNPSADPDIWADVLALLLARAS